MNTENKLGFKGIDLTPNPLAENLKQGDSIEILLNKEWIRVKFLSYYNELASGVFYYVGDFSKLKKVNNSVIVPFIDDSKWRLVK